VHLHHRGLAVKLQLVDPWMREFQVLAERCHPQMSVNMTAGCILTGVVVANKIDSSSTSSSSSSGRTAIAEEQPATKRVKLDNDDHDDAK
jgi:hypothetical protein